MKKRILGIMLAAALLFTMVPMTAFAEEGTAGQPVDLPAQSESTGDGVVDSGAPGTEDACACTVLCVPGQINPACPVCAAEGANLAEVCKGGAAAPALAASAEIADDIWIAGTKVTSENADDITGVGITGTVTYNPDTATLTLRNAKIISVYMDMTFDQYGIYVKSLSKDQLTIELEGTNAVDISLHVTERSSIGIKANCRIVIAGDGKLLAASGEGLDYSAGIQAPGIIVDGGRIDATAGKSGKKSIGIEADYVEIKSGTLNARGGGKIYNSAKSWGIDGAAGIYMSGGAMTIAGETRALSIPVRPMYMDSYRPAALAGNALDGSDAVPSPHDRMDTYWSRYVHVGTVQQDVWVGGQQVSDANVDDILGDGTAYYDLGTNTLFLNNANIRGAYETEGNFYGIYSPKSLKLVLSGNNSINPPPSSAGISCGIGTKETLTITGSGFLSINANDAVESIGILAGTLEVLNGKLKATTYRSRIGAAIRASTIFIKGGDIEAGGGVSEYSYGMESKNITISGGKVAAYSNRISNEWDESFAINTNSLIISGDDTRLNTWNEVFVRNDCTMHSGIVDVRGVDYGIRAEYGNLVIGNDAGSGVLWVKAQGGTSALNKAPILKPSADYYTITGAWNARQASWVMPQGAPDDNPGSTGSSGSSGGQSTQITFPTDNAIDATAGSDAASVIAKAIQGAVASARVSFRNYDAITPDGLEAINKIVAKETAGKAIDFMVNFDVMNQGVVESRITVDPLALAKEMAARGMTEKLPLGVGFDQQQDSRVQAVNALFGKYFSNKIVSVVYEQRSPLAVNAEFCARLDLAKAFGQDRQLYFYSYDNVKNRYSRITAPHYRVDKNGYAHITAPFGGSLIITDQPLTK